LDKAGGYTVSKATRRTEDYELFMRIQLFARGENLSEPLYHFLEDQRALKRRKYRYRIDEAKVRYRGFKSLGLLPKGIFYVIKPLIVGLIPSFILKRLRKERRKRQAEKTN
jgi:glycosyltransferase EpsE